MLRNATTVCKLAQRTLVAAATTVMPLVHAAEIVTLRSGFTITCTERVALSAETVRLYLPGSGPGSANYMDVASSSIAALETAAGSLNVEDRAVHATHRQEMGSLLQRSGAAHNVNVALLAAVIQTESAGNPSAVSHAGAKGLMQLMPGTATLLGVKQSFEPADNVNGGSTYLDQLLTRYHESIPLALAAYNAGPGAVDRYHGIPPFRETQLYVARVLKEFNRRTRQEISVRSGIASTLISNRVQTGGDR